MKLIYHLFLLIGVLVLSCRDRQEALEIEQALPPCKEIPSVIVSLEADTITENEPIKGKVSLSDSSFFEVGNGRIEPNIEINGLKIKAKRGVASIILKPLPIEWSEGISVIPQELRCSITFPYPSKSINVTLSHTHLVWIKRKE